MDPFIAEIRIFGFNFAPTGWAVCGGQLVPISQNTALFSLLGTNYGGDGKATFALPNLIERFALGAGQGPGLSPRALGEVGGKVDVTLSPSEMPAHSHPLMATDTPSTSDPSSASLAPTGNGAYTYRAPGGVMANMAADSVSYNGGGQPHENRQPTLLLNFCIAMQGVYPPRN